MTTPEARPRRPYLRCWHTYIQNGEPIPAGDPGTVLDIGGNDVLVFVGDNYTPSPETLEALAERLLGCHQVTILGDVWRVGKPLKRALQTAWSRRGRAARPPKPPRSPAPALGPHPRCGRPRADGQPCQQYAGHGADDPTGPCRAHGGSTVKREAEAEALVGKALRWVELSKKSRTEPLTVAERLEGLVAMRDMVAAQRKRRH